MSTGTGSVPTLYVCESTSYRLATSVEVLAVARRALAQQFRRGRRMDSPARVREYLQLALGTLEHEVFCLVLLDGRHQLLSCVEMFRGTIDCATVHPREVVKEALKQNAAAVILAHNHPSGVPEPSPADQQITRRLLDALQLVDIRVLDHVVVASGGTVSFAERGWL